MKINIDFNDLLRRLLPVDMIQQNRINLFWLIFKRLKEKWVEWAEFRDEKYIEANINFSKKTLEWWLNYKIYGNTDIGMLHIIFGGGNPYFVELGTEPVNVNNLTQAELDALNNVKLGNDGANEDMELSRLVDSFGNISTDFAVQSEQSLTDEQIEEINLIVEQYKTAGVSYQITYV